MRSRSSVRVKWCGQASAVTRTPRRFPSRTSSTERAVEMCWMCSRPPVISARRMSRATMMSSAAAGIPGRPSRIDSSPSFITPPTVSSGTWQCCMMTRSNILAYSRACRISEADGDRRPVVGEGDGAAGHELAELGQLLALAPLADGPDRIDVGLARPLGLEDDELGGPLAVERRDGVGHAGHARSRRRPGPPRPRWRSSRPPRCPARAGGRGGRSGPGQTIRPRASMTTSASSYPSPTARTRPRPSQRSVTWSMSWLGSIDPAAA